MNTRQITPNKPRTIPRGGRISRESLPSGRFGGGFFSLCLALFLATVCFTACKDDDSNLDTLIDEYEQKLVEQLKDIDFDLSELDEDESQIAFDSSDSVENFSVEHTVKITYTSNSVSVSGGATGIRWTADGARLTVNSTIKNVQYIVSGTADDGQLLINSDYKFRLDLDNVTLRSTDGPAIYSQSKKTMLLNLVENSQNTLIDGTTYTSVGSDIKMKGALYNRGNIVISGKGKLQIAAQGGHAIATDDYFRLRTGNQLVIFSACRSGIKANDGIYIHGSCVNIMVQSEAEGGKGLNSESDIVVDGGRTNIITQAASRMETADTTHCAGIKSDGNITVNAGEINIKSTGNNAKGMKADGNVVINGGEIHLQTFGEAVEGKPKALKADGNIAINAGKLHSFSLHSKPIDADNDITIADGYTTKTETAHFYNIAY